jgi:RNA polymerase sigma-70 factor (ECF subfamily)
VQALARRLLGDGEDARDAAQDALARLCTRLGQFRGEAAFSTWLHRLVVNACNDVAARRAAQRWEQLEDDARPCPAAGPAVAAELSELRAELRAGLSELPATQAQVVVLKDALDWSFAEIALASGMPVGTAKCYAHRGREGLRARLERDGTPA